MASLDIEAEWKWSPNRFGPFGWLETIIKAIAAGVAIGSIAAFSSDAPPLYALRIVEIVMVGISLFVHLLLVGQRFFYKEVFGFFFAIFVLIGHVVMFIILFQNAGQPGTFIFTFSFCYFLGEGCKFFYYFMKPPRVDWGAHVLLEEAWKRYFVSGLICLVMLICWICQLILWTTTYTE